VPSLIYLYYVSALPLLLTLWIICRRNFIRSYRSYHYWCFFLQRQRWLQYDPDDTVWTVKETLLASIKTVSLTTCLTCTENVVIRLRNSGSQVLEMRHIADIAYAHEGESIIN